MAKENIAKSLFDLGAVKFGQYKLKSGIISPIYIDLRITISYPTLLKAIAEAMWAKVPTDHFTSICGVPYTALPIASYLSIAHNKPMVLRRREGKNHGTCQLLEGVIHPGETCLILEDLITSGTSIFETITPLEEAGLNIKDVVAFLDREQGGRTALEQRGYHLHSVMTISELLHALERERCIKSQTVAETLTFIKNHQIAQAKELVYG